MQSARALAPSPVPKRLLVALGLGTLLNPLNSSMIAVALNSLHNSFNVGLVTTSWAVSIFYIGACVAQPLMGRLGDRFGAKRIYITGMWLVTVISVITPFATTFGAIIAARVVLALGTSVAFPSAVILIKLACAQSDQIPTRALGAITVTNSVSAAAGPVIGGILVNYWGWESIFWINIPLATGASVCGWFWLPRAQTAPTDTSAGFFSFVRSLDLPGVTAFSMTLISSLIVLLSIRDGPVYWPLIFVIFGGMWFVVRERRSAEPFLDLKMVSSNAPLLLVYAQFIMVNLVYYGVFYGLPQWLEIAKGSTPRRAGLLLFPTAAVGALIMPLVGRIIRNRGVFRAVTIGSASLVAASICIIFVHDALPLGLVVGFAILMGLPNGFNNLGLQSAMYNVANGQQMGVASGLFQTSRYIGAILATVMIGTIMGNEVTSNSFSRVGLVMTLVAVVSLIVAFLTTRRLQHRTARRHA